MAAKRKTSDAQIAEAQRMQKRGSSLQEIADKLGVPKPSLAEALRVAAGKPRRAPRKAAARRKSVKPARVPPASPPPKLSMPEPQASPQGGAVSTKPDLLELVRRILSARNPAARVELDEALRVHVAGGELALVTHLARPLEAADIDTDPMVTLRNALALGVAALQVAEPGPETSRALGIVEKLASRLERVMQGRPKVETDDEREARSREDADAVLRRIRKGLPELLAARAAS